MKLQVLQDNFGNDTGVYVPMADWKLIKRDYPDIELVDEDLPQWEKDLIDVRLQAIEENPSRIKQGYELLEEIKRKI